MEAALLQRGKKEVPINSKFHRTRSVKAVSAMDKNTVEAVIVSLVFKA